LGFKSLISLANFARTNVLTIQFSQENGMKPVLSFLFFVIFLEKLEDSSHCD